MSAQYPLHQREECELPPQNGYRWLQWLKSQTTLHPRIVSDHQYVPPLVARRQPSGPITTPITGPIVRQIQPVRKPPHAVRLEPDLSWLTAEPPNGADLFVMRQQIVDQMDETDEANLFKVTEEMMEPDLGDDPDATVQRTTARVNRSFMRAIKEMRKDN